MAGGGESREEALARLVAANTRPDASGEERAIHQIILDAATDPARQLTATELARVLRHIAGAGFDPLALERVRGNLVGVIGLNGTIIERGDRLLPVEIHYLRHVIAQREWPAGTTLAAYVASIPRIVTDPESGILVCQYQGAWQLTLVRESHQLRGPDGHRWLLVDYRLQTGHWTTAHQLVHGLSSLGPPRREQIRWLRPLPTS